MVSPRMGARWIVQASNPPVGHVTLKRITPKLLKAVVSIGFDRSRPADIEAARACDEALHDTFATGGYVPYRLGVQHQGRARTAGEE